MISFLNGWARHRTVGAIHAAIPWFRLNQSAAASAFVVILACIDRHGFRLPMLTSWTQDHGFQNDLISHCVKSSPINVRHRCTGSTPLWRRVNPNKCTVKTKLFFQPLTDIANTPKPRRIGRPTLSKYRVACPRMVFLKVCNLFCLRFAREWPLPR